MYEAPMLFGCDWKITRVDDETIDIEIVANISAN